MQSSSSTNPNSSTRDSYFDGDNSRLYGTLLSVVFAGTNDMTATMNPLELMRIGPVIPVIVIDDIENAVPLARALVAGGVRVLEVTLRTRAALDAIQAIAGEVPDAIVGVGTISRVEHFEQAIEAGARFGVSPGLTHELVEATHASGLPLLPG